MYYEPYDESINWITVSCFALTLCICLGLFIFSMTLASKTNNKNINVANCAILDVIHGDELKARTTLHLHNTLDSMNHFQKELNFIQIIMGRDDLLQQVTPKYEQACKDLNNERH
jgi:lipopolysaccharide export LptBFGC system permease protein LptF